MDLFGDKLKEIRLEKDFSLDQIARETKISRKYLEAIEENDFTIFPSETYLIGFLRTYTEYLGLDSTKYINQYRNYKIQEQPIPINELLDMKKRVHPAFIVLLVVLGIGVVGTGSIFLYQYFFNTPGPTVTSEEPVAETATGEDYYFKDEVSTFWFSEQDRIIMPLGEQEYILEVSGIGDEVSLLLGAETYTLAEQREVILNLNQDDNDDVRIVLNTVEEREGRKQVNLGLYKITAAITSTMTVVHADSPAAESGTEEVAASPAGLADAAGQFRDTTVIFESGAAESFVINIQFEGQCLLRYLKDNRSRFQRFFQNNEALEIEDINREVVLWISNAGSINASISGKKIVFGRAGQVVTKLLRWRYDAAINKYKLELSSIY